MLAILNWSLPSILFIIGVFTFVSNRKHLLSILLSLEYIVLSLFLLLFIYLNTYKIWKTQKDVADALSPQQR